jgi:hypothetical protein
MRDHTTHVLIQAIKDHPDVVNAAITGSRPRRAGTDRFSDLDVLLVVRDIRTVSNVRLWLPESERILICAFHLSNYCTVLLDNFQKIDIAIFPADCPSSRWVVQDYEVIKGSEDFETQLAEAAKTTRQKTKSGYVGVESNQVLTVSAECDKHDSLHFRNRFQSAG